MMLKNQSWAHVFLIKLIAAAVVFEKVKFLRKNLRANLDEYRIELKVANLLELFYSLSFRGRQALEAILKY